MKVWTLNHWCDDGSDGSFGPYAMFATRENAAASAEVDDEIEEWDVSEVPLATEQRWRVTEKYRPDRRGMREVSPAKRYTVNELNAEYGKGLLASRYDFGAFAGYSAPTAGEARNALRGEIAPSNKEEQERLDYLARCTHQYRCPDHGDLSMSAPGGHVCCVKCHRWVDDRGVRFGYYVNTKGDGGPFSVGIRFSASGVAPDVDQGPLPDAELAELTSE